MSKIETVEIDDGKNDISFGFDMAGKKILACTIHEEFLDITGVPKEMRETVAQGLGQTLIGMLKPFMELAS